MVAADIMGTVMLSSIFGHNSMSVASAAATAPPIPFSVSPIGRETASIAAEPQRPFVHLRYT